VAIFLMITVYKPLPFEMPLRWGKALFSERHMNVLGHKEVAALGFPYLFTQYQGFEPYFLRFSTSGCQM
jgi:hypothetical protein